MSKPLPVHSQTSAPSEADFLAGISSLLSPLSARAFEDVNSPDVAQPDASPMDERLGGQPINGTAYRIFKLLQWLIQSPLTLDALNRKFREEPRIGRGVSNDSVWLYINTLKTLGCRFRRPSPKNGFQYELLSHPFGLSLPESRLDTLARAKAHAQKSFSHREMLILDRLFKKIIRHSNVAVPQDGIDALFRQSRSADMETLQEHIRVLEGALGEDPLFRLRYHSPVRGEETFFFVPELLFYEQGVMYVRGDREHGQGSSSLRADRILSLQVVDDEPLRTRILQRRAPQVEVKIRLFAPTPELWSGLGLNERHGVSKEQWMVCTENGTSSVALSLWVRDFFYLKQRLLSGGVPFQILAPHPFRDEVETTLQAMLRFYHAPASASLSTDSDREKGSR